MSIIIQRNEPCFNEQYNNSNVLMKLKSGEAMGTPATA